MKNFFKNENGAVNLQTQQQILLIALIVLLIAGLLNKNIKHEIGETKIDISAIASENYCKRYRFSTYKGKYISSDGTFGYMYDLTDAQYASGHYEPLCEMSDGTAANAPDYNEEVFLNSQK